MEDLESKLSAFIGEVKSGWICMEIKDGESSCVHSRVILPLFFKLLFSQVGSCRIHFDLMRHHDS